MFFSSVKAFLPFLHPVLLSTIFTLSASSRLDRKIVPHEPFLQQCFESDVRRIRNAFVDVIALAHAAGEATRGRNDNHEEAEAYRQFIRPTTLQRQSLTHLEFRRVENEAQAFLLFIDGGPPPEGVHYHIDCVDEERSETP